MIALANTEFHYLRDCPCTVDVVPGDGRLALEREPGQHFDVLVVDAFNGDSIPVHLLTREAFAAYRRHLAPGGTLAFHVTNRHLDLAPMVHSLAEEAHMQSSLFRNEANKDSNIYQSTWVLVTDNAQLLAALSARSIPFPAARPSRPWTDDYSSLFQVLR